MKTTKKSLSIVLVFLLCFTMAGIGAATPVSAVPIKSGLPTTVLLGTETSAVTTLADVDTTPPALTVGEAKRVDLENAEVTFKSSEAGSYSYIVQETTASPPTPSDVQNSGNDDIIDAGENTINLTGLVGFSAKKIYIVAKDAAGNQSLMLTIDIPKFMATPSVFPPENKDIELYGDYKSFEDVTFMNVILSGAYFDDVSEVLPLTAKIGGQSAPVTATDNGLLFFGFGKDEMNELPAGVYPITVESTGNDANRLFVATRVGELTVNKSDNTIANLDPVQAILGDPDQPITPTANENPDFSFSSSAPDVVSVDSSGKLSFLKVGSAEITVTSSETTNYKRTADKFSVSVSPDTTALQAQIAATKTLLKQATPNIGDGDGQYPQNAVDKLEKAIDDAELTAANATLAQHVIDQAVEDLKKAIELFESSKFQRAFGELKKNIDDAQKALDDLGAGGIGNGNGQYPQNAVDELKKAIDDAKQILNSAPQTQDVILTAVLNLKTANAKFIDSLCAVDFAALTEAVAKAEAMQKGNYTDETWNKLQAALSAGQILIDQVGVTQTEADNATAVLNAAMAGLREKASASPNTGNHDNLPLMLAIMVAAFGMMTLTIAIKKRRCSK